MPSATPEQLETIRGAILRHVADTSLRHAAREIGLSPSGLSNFLTRVSTPYGKTRAKLLAWFSRHGWQMLDSSEAAARAALALLVEGLPEEGRDDTRRKIVEAIRHAHLRHYTQPPAWLEHLATDEPPAAAPAAEAVDPAPDPEIEEEPPVRHTVRGPTKRPRG
jgi:phage terminase small subunit